MKKPNCKLCDSALLDSDFFDPSFVSELFNEMSATYGITNLISSFGFSHRWRKFCIKSADIKPGMEVCDLMSGMGESWKLINNDLENEGRLVALDFSHEMCKHAEDKKGKFTKLDIQLLQEDFLKNSIPPATADRVVSAFGLKTFSDEQKKLAAIQIDRILKRGGRFSLLEISVPDNPTLRLLYMFYLKRIIPILGKLFMGNPDNYRLLGIYTEHFRNCESMKSYLCDQGLEVEYKNLFFGCATQLTGRKISEAD